MCGILGLVNLDKTLVDPNVFSNIAQRLDHRGPDGEGFWYKDNVSIAHKRLKIIDLSEHGAQPMRSNDNRYILSFNGEIYNFQEIKKLLIGKGYTFKSKTDSEVVVNAYQEWGLKCLDLFNGMFAFIIWDKQKKEMILARDRYGIKPLYYFKNDQIFMFSSEIKPIISHPKYPMNININAIDQYFTFQNNLLNETLFKEINILDSGSYIIFNEKNNTIKKHKYWDYKFEEDKTISKEDAIEEVDRLFKLSVNRQLMSDVELGSYLSGGMDSGAITSIASQKFNQLKTFTIGFDMQSISGMELGFDERDKARFLSNLYQTDHYESILKPNDMEKCLESLVQIIENPVVGQSYPNYYAAKLARDHVKVVFSGAGGDELFAGYPWRYQYSSNNKNSQEYIKKYYKYWSRILQDEEKESFYHNSIIKEVKNNSFKSFENMFKNESFLNTREDYINKSLKFECETFLHGLLILEDKISMSFGLESRVPFLDNDLVDFAMKIPLKHKLDELLHDQKFLNQNITKKREFYSETNDGKIVLRNVFKKYVTEEYSKGKKQGFSGPDGSWFKGDSINYVKSLIDKKNALIYNYLDRKNVKSKLDLHFSGKKNNRLLIWSLMNFEIWLNTFLND